jgi:penicillin amidase
MSLFTFISKFPRRLTVAVLAAIVIIALFSRFAAVAALAGVLLAISGFYGFLRLSLPRIQSRIRVSGLKAQVEILRDADYIPHIYANHKLDAYFGLGYVHAQDRLWQMDFQRRLGQGRLSELMGPGGLPFDRLTRTLGFYHTAKRIWELTDVATREIVNSYVAGINAFVTAQKIWQRQPEFMLLRTNPELWSGADVMLMSVLMSWNLSGNYVTELLRERLVRAVGPEQAREFMPEYLPAKEKSVSEAIEKHAADLQLLLKTSDEDDARAIGEGVGSNMWMVSIAKCNKGGPVLANDPHMPSTNPMTWYLAHLTAPGLRAIGATTPGIPAVIIGRNSHVAWGMTNLNPDVQDFFLEKIDETEKKYEFEGRTVTLEIREETVRVKNRPDVTLKIASTRHGPIVNDVMGGEDAELAKDDFLKSCGALSFQWTGMNPENSSLRGFLLLAEARNWPQFLDALKCCTVPAVNFGYADVEGNIGYHAAGRVPVRRNGDGSRPAEGWSGDYEWVNFIPFEELPHAYNPSQNYVVSVNCPPPDPASPWFLSSDWVEPYRFERIAELLNASERLSTETHMAIQADTFSSHAREMLPLLLPHITAGNPVTSHAVELLRNWDRKADKNSVAATIFGAWNLHLLHIVVRGKMDDRLLNAYEPWSSSSNRFLQNFLKSRIDGQDEPGQHIQTALQAALKDLSKRLGSDMNEWQWGKVHRAILPHIPLNRVAYLRPFFSRSVAVGGDWSTVNFGAYVAKTPFLQRNIAGYRQIIDMSGLNGSYFIHAAGQSGHFLSPHFDDFMQDWAAVKYRPMRFERSAVERDTKAKLLLEPITAA